MFEFRQEKQCLHCNVQVDGLFHYNCHKLNINSLIMPKIPVCSTYDGTLEVGIKGSKAHKLRLDGYEDRTDKVMIKYSSINPAHLSPMVQEIYSLFGVLNKVFGTADSFKGKALSTGHSFVRPLDCNSDPFICREQLRSIGIAGSSALALLEGHLATRDDGSVRGRWWKSVSDYHSENGTQAGDLQRDLIAMEMKHTRGGKFKVKDIDVFFTRGYGYEGLGFSVVCKMITEEIASMCSITGVKVKVEEMRRNCYVARDEMVLIQDMIIGDGNIKISLIQQPLCDDIDSVVDDFDIDVCRVVYNPFEEVLYVDQHLMDRIIKGVATVSDLTATCGGPDKFDMVRINSTVSRMYKYRQRGYTFDRLPNLHPTGIFPRRYQSDSDSD